MNATKIAVGVTGRGSRLHPHPNPPADRVQASTTVTRITIAGARGGQGTSTIAAVLAMFAAEHRTTRLSSTEPAAIAALLGLPPPDADQIVPVRVIDQLELTTEPEEGVLTVADVGRIDQLPGKIDGGISIVVVRGACYLALRSVVAATGPKPDGIILMRELGRSLTARDVAYITGVPVIAQIPVTAAVARTIDAGLLIARLHNQDEFAPLRRWTQHKLAPRRRSLARTALESTVLTAVKDRHRLSHLRQAANGRRLAATVVAGSKGPAGSSAAVLFGDLPERPLRPQRDCLRRLR